MFTNNPAGIKVDCCLSEAQSARPAGAKESQRNLTLVTNLAVPKPFGLPNFLSSLKTPVCRATNDVPINTASTSNCFFATTSATPKNATLTGRRAPVVRGKALGHSKLKDPLTITLRKSGEIAHTPDRIARRDSAHPDSASGRYGYPGEVCARVFGTG